MSSNCHFCNSPATDELQFIFAKKMSRWYTDTKTISLPCCERCNTVLLHQRKRIKKVKWITFIAILLLSSALILLFVPKTELQTRIIYLVLGSLAGWVLARCIYTIFFRTKYDKIEQSELDAIGMHHIEDAPIVKDLLAQGYTIGHKY